MEEKYTHTECCGDQTGSQLFPRIFTELIPQDFTHSEQSSQILLHAQLNIVSMPLAVLRLPGCPTSSVVVVGAVNIMPPWSVMVTI